jgi:hypothetical protein
MSDHPVSPVGLFPNSSRQPGSYSRRAGVRTLRPFFMPLFTQVPGSWRLLGIPYAGSRIDWNPDAAILTQSLNNAASLGTTS